MSDVNTISKVSVFQRIREAWPIVTFGVAMAVAIAGAWLDVRMAQAENSNGIKGNYTSIENLKESLATKAAKFITDAEIQRLWDDLKEQATDMSDLERRVQQLGITDERVNAKIELEVEKLRAEIQRAASEQQRALQEQTGVMQQILREVQSNN